MTRTCADCKKPIVRHHLSARCVPCQATRRLVMKAAIGRIRRERERELREDSETIEMTFQAALAVAKRTKRETVLGWQSPLARIV